MVKAAWAAFLYRGMSRGSASESTISPSAVRCKGRTLLRLKPDLDHLHGRYNRYCFRGAGTQTGYRQRDCLT